MILATDGDFNVGVTDQDELVKLIEAKAKSGVFLSVLGFGMGNLKDGTARERSPTRGTATTPTSTRSRRPTRCWSSEMGATLVTIAKDVKIQVEFNPAKVGAYRLIGYENRMLRHQDFNDDTKDAGEIGAGHHVTALYELVPPGHDGAAPPGERRPAPVPAATPRCQQRGGKPRVAGRQAPVQAARRRHEPADRAGRRRRGPRLRHASDDFKFAAAVAGFGMLLRDSPDKGSLTYPAVLELAEASKGSDRSGYRAEFVDLVRKAESVSK